MTRRRGCSDAGAAREAVVALLDRFSHSLPRLVVLDLDYTCWPFCEWLEAYLLPVPGLLVRLPLDRLWLTLCRKARRV